MKKFISLLTEFYLLMFGLNISIFFGIWIDMGDIEFETLTISLLFLGLYLQQKTINMLSNKLGI